MIDRYDQYFIDHRDYTVKIIDAELQLSVVSFKSECY